MDLGSVVMLDGLAACNIGTMCFSSTDKIIMVIINSRWRCVSNLKVGDGVRGGEPAHTRVLLVAEWTTEGLCDGTEVKGTHCRGSNAVTVEGNEGSSFKQSKLIYKPLNKRLGLGESQDNHIFYILVMGGTDSVCITYNVASQIKVSHNSINHCTILS